MFTFYEFSRLCILLFLMCLDVVKLDYNQILDKKFIVDGYFIYLSFNVRSTRSLTIACVYFFIINLFMLRTAKHYDLKIYASGMCESFALLK